MHLPGVTTRSGSKRAWRATVVAFSVVGALALAVSALGGAPQGKRSTFERRDVTTASDGARAKLQDELREKLDSGSKEQVVVHALLAPKSVVAAKKYLAKSWVAKRGDVAILVGVTSVPKTLKLAGIKGVATVDLAVFGKSGQPTDVPDDGKKKRRKKHHGPDRSDVPYADAPPPLGSRFDQVKSVDLLDARTHNFKGAWAAGYTGTGVTVGVLDGGTDFGHPDLLGTWKTWESGEWAGWPMAFDPYGTLVLLAAPELVSQGLTFYTPTEPAGACKEDRRAKPGPDADEGKGKWARKGNCTVELTTRTGPSRNFAAPDGTVAHTYLVKSAWSKSGTFRFGSHPDDHLLASYGERPAFIVADSTTAGVYDTVYVDLDDDHDFTDEKPVTKASPASYRDMNADGYTDISGGLLAYISDGSTSIPGGVTEFVGDDPGFIFGPGEILMWSGDFDPAIEGHGTLTASNIVGQGVSTGGAPRFADLGAKKYPGVLGGAPDAKLVPYSDIYFAFEFSTQFGYFLSAVNGVDVTSNSYGTSEIDNDGFDAASIEADLMHRLFGSRTVPLFSTGNGAPGYGTTSPPSPSAGISVGASTQFGGTGWDSIRYTTQIVDNDVIEWSNRGPGANGTAGVDVVADGAFSPGDVTLNEVGDGRYAWASWGGTSRSTPVAAAAAALTVQSYEQNVGTPGAGFFDDVRRALKSSAVDLGYDSFTQGAGSIDAGRAVKAIAGRSLVVRPDAWQAGSAVTGGGEYADFPNSIAPGASSTKSFSLAGGAPSSISDRYLTLADAEEFPFSSKDQASESPYTFQSPDYLLDLTSKVDAHPDADLLVIRVNFKRSALDPDANLAADQAWRLLPYNWTDVNHDGRLWKDKDGDGVVDHSVTKDVDIDDHEVLDFRKSEIQEGEYIRFMYHRPDHNALVSYVRSPNERTADGLFLGLQHSLRDPAQATTEFTVRLEWYENVDWPWLSTSPTAGGFEATLDVPADAAPGMYQGAVVVEVSDGSTSVVPVTAAVTPTLEQDDDGKLTGSLVFGGADVAAAQSNLSFNNGTVFGASDWTWRQESGDWRFFFFDIAEPPAPGSLLLAETSWDDPGPFTDVDTLVMGPSENDYSNGALDLLYGPGASAFFAGYIGLAPYTLDTTGKSPNAYQGSGIWGFDTSTGSNGDVVASPVFADGGLHAIVWHQVGWDGGRFHVPVTTSLTAASVEPSTIVDDAATSPAGSYEVVFEAGSDPGAVTAEAFGLGEMTSETLPLSQDDPNDTATSSIKKTITVGHAARIEISVDASDSIDTDLYVRHNGQTIAASATGSADEAVTLVLPDDGTYEIWVHGFQVNPSPQDVQLDVKTVQGSDLTASVAQVANSATVTVEYDRPLAPGTTYFGELLLGPASAPRAISVPIEITAAP